MLSVTNKHDFIWRLAQLKDRAVCVKKNRLSCNSDSITFRVFIKINLTNSRSNSVLNKDWQYQHISSVSRLLPTKIWSMIHRYGHLNFRPLKCYCNPCKISFSSCHFMSKLNFNLHCKLSSLVFWIKRLLWNDVKYL